MSNCKTTQQITFQFIVLSFSATKLHSLKKTIKCCRLSGSHWKKILTFYPIGHFQIVLCFFSKARLRAKLVMWKWVLSACEWKLKTRFEKEVHVQDNLEMAYSMTSKLPADTGLIILSSCISFLKWYHNYNKTQSLQNKMVAIFS